MKYSITEINTFLKLGTTTSIISILFILWLFIAKVDIIANTTGKIITESKIQSISILDKSSLDQLLVKEGDLVHKGQVVAILDRTVQNSTQKQINTEVKFYSIRIKAIDSLLQNQIFTKENNDDSLEFNQINSEFTAKKLNYNNNLLSIQAEISQYKSELDSNIIYLEKLKNSKLSWERQVQSYEKMKENGFVASLTAEEKIREGKEKIEEIKIQQSSIAVNQSKITQANMKLQMLKSDFSQQLLKEKTELLQKIRNLSEEQVKTDYNISIKDLTSPVDGFVKDITTNSHNSVITEGTILMTIVPKNEKLKAEIFVKNIDIGYIVEGQKVNIKIETFAFQKYGLIHGRINKISPDATEDKDTKQNLYRIEVTLDNNYLEQNHQKYYIKPGMIVNADIILSKRSIFEYLTSPLQKTILESARER